MTIPVEHEHPQSVERGLTDAIERDELLLRYQPVVALADSSIVGAEALLRWNPADGPVAPQEFIGAAEETGLIVPIGAWVLENACSQLAAWQHEPDHADLTMAVNVSPLQLQREEFADEVAQVISGAGIDAAALTLELTENVLMEDTELSRDQLHSLKELGVQLAVDDFGTGHSSLDYLRRFEFDEVKIDQSFAIDVPEGAREARMARAVCDFVHLLGFSTTVEGIEHESQAEFFEDLGCGRAQGYAFSPPVDADAFDLLLAHRCLPATTYGTSGSLRAARDSARTGPIALVVEDSDAMADIETRNLQHAGYQPIVVRTMSEARGVLDAVAPAVAFVDLRLPDGNGWTLIEAMRADERLESVPTVVVTGLCDASTVERAHRHRCSHLAKPFPPDAMTYRMNEAFELLR